MSQLDFSKKILTELLEPANTDLFNKEFVKCLYWIRNDKKSYDLLVDWVIKKINDDNNYRNGRII